MASRVPVVGQSQAGLPASRVPQRTPQQDPMAHRVPVLGQSQARPPASRAPQRTPQQDPMAHRVPVLGLSQARPHASRDQALEKRNAGPRRTQPPQPHCGLSRSSEHRQEPRAAGNRGTRDELARGTQRTNPRRCGGHRAERVRLLSEPAARSSACVSMSHTARARAPATYAGSRARVGNSSRVVQAVEFKLPAREQKRDTPRPTRLSTATATHSVESAASLPSATGTAPLIALFDARLRATRNGSRITTFTPHAQ